ncbi:mRNA export factor rsm1 [Tolypocladium ophioglossoides CBS 100239]|uniref:mRNA export factor rsm1 n=1 Tax=Tolypocladium ophioglossoides (strain CBS 100239) TaxID=1163406 RepID=A0A0L0N4E9_TOLOC|nr:mRNA export factor rsm1 [Tolypocladium ophioglossoides CBS 100239]
MHATKRKFNALLQGLSNPRSSTSESAPKPMSGDSQRGASAVASQDVLLQKRRRMGFPESTAPTIYSSSSNTVSSISSVVLRRPGTQTGAKSGKDALAKYCPGDRDELLKRLATFQELTDWTPKPDRVNEVEWAKRGWICQGKEKVRWVLCHKELIVKLNRKEVDGEEVPVLVPSEIDGALVDKYCELIVASHQQDCLWRKRGCDDTLLRLSFSNSTATLAALRQRYDELCSRASFLPYEFNLRLPDKLNLDEILSQLPCDFFTEPAPSEKPDASTAKPVNRAALALALMGWQGLSNARIGAVPNSASCHSCLRRLGLWMFKSKEVGDNGQVLVPAPMDFLDPLREHRFFCPWKSAQAQSRGAASGAEIELAGWETLSQTIKNGSHLRDVYEGRPKRLSRIFPDSIAPSTSARGASSMSGTPAVATPTGPDTPVADAAHDDGEVDEKARDAKDKERWARLRKVRSLFDTKAAKKFRRPLSRPGTGHSNKSGGA